MTTSRSSSWTCRCRRWTAARPARIKRRPRTRDAPIIFLTAMGVDAEHSARGYAAGAVDYIRKHFDPWALRAKVAVFTSIYLERYAQ